MAERIVSPGVFTQENDLSFLPVGIGEIGAVIIGNTESGPAFVPTVVRSMNEFELKFGSSTSGTYVPFTVKEYIKNAGVVTIVRTLGLDGFSVNNQVFLIASGSSTGPSGSTVNATTSPFILGVLHASTAGDGSSTDGTLEETSLLGGSITPGNKAGGNFTMNNEDSAGGAPLNLEFQIGTSDSDEFRFIGVGGTAPADGGGTFGPFYFLTGSSDTANATNLVAQINAHATNVTANSEGTQVSITSSATGLGGNSIRVQSGSGTTFSTVLTLAGGTADSLLSEAFSGALTGTGVLTLAKFFGNSGYLSSTSNTCSFDKTNNNYLPNLVGTDPGKFLPTATLGTPTNLASSYIYSLFNSQSYGAAANNKGGGYVFTRASASAGTIDFDSAAASVTGTNSTTSGKSFKAGATPWVISQTSNGNNFPLFRFHTMAHGTTSNRYYKVSVVAIKKAGSVSGQDYGNFSVTLRKIDDTDNKVVAVESYANCNLDPNSPNYIARLIGDREISTDGNGKVITTGDYPNISRHIRVEVHENVRNAVYSDQLVPFGHEPYISPFTLANQGGGLNQNAFYPEAALITSRSISTDTTTYFGFNFDEDILTNGMYNYLAPLSDNAATGYNRTFLLENCTDGNSGDGAITLDSTLNKKRFTLAFQGGFDGVNPAKQVTIGKDLSSGNSFGFSFASTSEEGYRVYKRALDTVSNPDEIDINLIVTPGILTANASNICTKVIEVCEERGDAFYVVDGVNSLSGAAVAAAVTQAANFDTNYAAMYYPWVRVFDATVNKFLFVPPSVVVPGVYSFNDKVAFPWFAPAGLNRGSLTTVTEPYSRLTHAERDELYEGKVNPIAIFPQVGVCVWGQKTLQTKPSALDRINVRRLLIKLKKFIASSTRYLVFENNTTATRNRFLNIVNPYLETVQQQQGLFAFKVVMDETNNTPDVIDRNQMKGEIFLQPAKAAEFIIVDFNILRTGASFEE